MTFDFAWIGWGNMFVDYRSLIAGDADTGFDPHTLGTWAPWEFWQGNAGSWNTISLTPATLTAVEYFSIANHNLGSVGGQLSFEGSNDNVTWDVIASASAVAVSGGEVYDGSFHYSGTTSYSSSAQFTNSVLAFKINPGVSYTHYRLRVYAAGGKPIIGICAAGRRLDFELGFYNGFTPPSWNDDVDTTNNNSEKGVFLGRSAIRSGVKGMTINLQYVTYDWLNNEWLPFKNAASLNPFIFSWGQQVAKDNAFCWQKSWAQAQTIDRRWASCGMTFEGTLT